MVLLLILLNVALVLNGQALFSTSTNDTIGSKQIVPGKPVQNDSVKKGTADEPVADMKILRSLAKYLWLKDNLEFRLRVLMALGLLVGAKLLFWLVME